MAAKNKILAFLLLILLVLILYLILTSEAVKKTSGPNQPAENKNVILSEEDYKAKAKEIFSVYEKLALENSLTIDKVEELRNELLSLRISGQAKPIFQKLHLTFVQALDKTKDYLSSKIEQEKLTSQQMMDKLKADYSWLSN